MSVLLDTRSVAVHERREAWTDAHTRALFPLTVDVVDDRSFVGRTERHRLGDIGLLRIRGDACVVRRTRRGIAMADPEHLVLALLLGGRCAIEQDRRRSSLERGDLTTWSSSRPFRIPHGDRLDLMLMSVPAAALGASRSHRTAGVIPGSRGAGAIATQLLRESWRQLEGAHLASSDPDLQDALLAVTRAVCGDSRASLAPGASAPATLVPRVRAYAERHLDDPGLTPAGLARAHHVSLRYLHRAFRAEDETVSAWIRKRRLERCRDDLLDPDLDHLPVGVVAARWGMENHSHFSRAFRAAFGVSPRDVRQTRPPGQVAP